MSTKPVSFQNHVFPLVDENDVAVKAQLMKEVERLELQLLRLKKHGQYLDAQSLRMYQDMLESRKDMLESLS